MSWKWCLILVSVALLTLSPVPCTAAGPSTTIYRLINHSDYMAEIHHTTDGKNYKACISYPQDDCGMNTKRKATAVVILYKKTLTSPLIKVCAQHLPDGVENVTATLSKDLNCSYSIY